MTGPPLDHPDFLPPPPALQTALRAGLPPSWRVEWLAGTGSTNADLMARARLRDGAPLRPWLLGCHLQAHGRGRAGRSWQNRAGANLMFSCAFDVFLPAHQLPALAPLIGTSTCEVLRSRVEPRSARRLSMKWPNDILWDDAKLAGILIETTRAGTAPALDHFIVVIGLGLNLDDARALSMSLDRKIADWAGICADDASAARADAASLVGGLASAWYHEMNAATAQGFARLPERHAAVDALHGRPIDIIDEGRLLHTGVACGIDERGRLRLRNAGGEVAVSVGEVSARTRP